MNDEKQVVKLAAERLLEWCNGAALEESGGEGFGWRTINTSEISAAPFVRWITGHQCRIRPPAVAPVPKPSQAVLDACKRLGVEAWKLDRFLKGDRILGNGSVSERDGDTYGQACSPIVWTADNDQDFAGVRYWHVRPIAATLPCPQRPTPEQVAAARMPDGRRVKEPTVCEVPNGRAWFADSSPRVYAGSKVPASEYGQRRWIAEPADAVVEPWTLDTVPMPMVVRIKLTGCLAVATFANEEGVLTVGTELLHPALRDGQTAPATVMRRSYAWLLDNATMRDGQPCGVAK